MEELYELKKKLCDELKEYGKKDMSAGSLDVIDKLCHAIKNLDKIIDGYDYGYSGRRDARGRYASDYSYNRDMVGELRHMMDHAPDERTRQDMHNLIRRMESM